MIDEDSADIRTDVGQHKKVLSPVTKGGGGNYDEQVRLPVAAALLGVVVVKY